MQMSTQTRTTFIEQDYYVGLNRNKAAEPLKIPPFFSLYHETQLTIYFTAMANRA